MKNKLSPGQIVSVIVLIVVSILGAYLGFLTYRYKVVTRGILSILILYLVFQVAWFVKGEKIDILFTFPRNIKYYLFGFVWALIAIWAIGFIVEMIMFLI